MKYYSEMTDKVYETQEECEKAEEALVAKKKSSQKRKNPTPTRQVQINNPVSRERREIQKGRR